MVEVVWKGLGEGGGDGEFVLFVGGESWVLGDLLFGCGGVLRVGIGEGALLSWMMMLWTLG